MNNLEFAKKMQGRTMAFAVQVIKFFVKLPKADEARVPGRQLLRAGTSVAANYRAVCRAKSEADFISKMGTVVEEAEESVFWLELLEQAGFARGHRFNLCIRRELSCFESFHRRWLPPSGTAAVEFGTH